MSDQKPKGHGPAKVAPFTEGPGGKGHNWPKSGDPNTKGWSEKVKGGQHTTPQAPPSKK